PPLYVLVRPLLTKQPIKANKTMNYTIHITDKNKHDFHPYADIFPLLEGEEFNALVEDIRAKGQLVPIVTHEGKILDGRNRYRACIEAGIEPRLAPYEGDDPLSYIVSLNLERRHLNESQRAMVAAKLATMGQGARTDLAQICAMSQSDAAERTNVSRR